VDPGERHATTIMWAVLAGFLAFIVVGVVVWFWPA